MSHKTFVTISGTILSVIALLHLARLVAGWPARVGTWDVPTWVSWVTLILAAFLAVSAFRLRAR